MGQLINALLCIFIFFFIILFVLRIRKAANDTDSNGDAETEQYSFNICKRKINAHVKEIIYSRPEDMSVSYQESQKRRESKEILSRAKRDAPVGDMSARIYLMSFISNALQTVVGINDQTIDFVFPFHNKRKLDDHTIFLTLMYTVYQNHGAETWNWLQQENDLDRLRENGRYEIYQSDINMMFDKYVSSIPYTIKLDVLTQRVYEDLFGNGRVDFLLTQNVEDLSVGQGGVPGATDSAAYKKTSSKWSSVVGYNKVTLLYKGKNLHLRFTGMGSEKELQRVCRHICLYNNPGELSEADGYIENSMANGDRVVVYRDGFGDSWGFLVRKHKEGTLLTLKDMYQEEKQKNAHYIHRLGHALMQACLSSVISGQMYSGKTTLLCALINEANPNYNYRGLESVFETYIRKLFPTRNCATFMEREDLSGDKVLEFLKRTNGTVLVLGEMLKEVSANWLISAAQSGFKFVLTTTHTKTVVDLINWLLKAMLNTSGANNAELVVKEIVNAIHFDIHCGLNELTGERFVERITEIIPTNAAPYYTYLDIVVYNESDHIYEKRNPLSKSALDAIHKYLPDIEFSEIVAEFGPPAFAKSSCAQERGMNVKHN